MTRYLQNAAILSGKRSRTATATFVAAPADKLKRESRGIVLPSSRFTKTWWQEHVATLTPAAPEVPDDQAIVTPAQPALNAKAKRAVRTRATFPYGLAVQGDRCHGHLKNGTRLQDSQEVSPLSCVLTLINDDYS